MGEEPRDSARRLLLLNIHAGIRKAYGADVPNVKIIVPKIRHSITWNKLGHSPNKPFIVKDMNPLIVKKYIMRNGCKIWNPNKPGEIPEGQEGVRGLNGEFISWLSIYPRGVDGSNPANRHIFFWRYSDEVALVASHTMNKNATKLNLSSSANRKKIEKLEREYRNKKTIKCVQCIYCARQYATDPIRFTALPLRDCICGQVAYCSGRCQWDSWNDPQMPHKESCLWMNPLATKEMKDEMVANYIKLDAQRKKDHETIQPGFSVAPKDIVDINYVRFAAARAYPLTPELAGFCDMSPLDPSYFASFFADPPWLAAMAPPKLAPIAPEPGAVVADTVTPPPTDRKFDPPSVTHEEAKKEEEKTPVGEQKESDDVESSDDDEGKEEFYIPIENQDDALLEWAEANDYKLHSKHNIGVSSRGMVRFQACFVEKGLPSSASERQTQNLAEGSVIDAAQIPAVDIILKFVIDPEAATEYRLVMQAQMEEEKKEEEKKEQEIKQMLADIRAKSDAVTVEDGEDDDDDGVLVDNMKDLNIEAEEKKSSPPPPAVVAVPPPPETTTSDAVRYTRQIETEAGPLVLEMKVGEETIPVNYPAFAKSNNPEEDARQKAFAKEMAKRVMKGEQPPMGTEPDWPIPVTNYELWVQQIKTLKLPDGSPAGFDIEKTEDGHRNERGQEVLKCTVSNHVSQVVFWLVRISSVCANLQCRKFAVEGKGDQVECDKCRNIQYCSVECLGKCHKVHTTTCDAVAKYISKNRKRVDDKLHAKEMHESAAAKKEAKLKAEAEALAARLKKRQEQRAAAKNRTFRDTAPSK